MEVADYVAALRVHGEGLAIAASAAGWDAAVPTCPEWAVRDLVRHVGGVHRWAAGQLTGTRRPSFDDLEEVSGGWPDDRELLDWFRHGVEALASELEHADPALECWTFLAAPSPLAMWARRQAHETAVHRIDAAAAAGLRHDFAPPFAADGVDELLSCFITRPASGPRADPERTLLVRADDAVRDWLVRIGPDGVTTTSPAGGGAHCEVRGAASDVYLALWNRQDAGALTVRGDEGVLASFLDQVRVRWR